MSISSVSQAGPQPFRLIRWNAIRLPSGDQSGSRSETYRFVRVICWTAVPACRREGRIADSATVGGPGGRDPRSQLSPAAAVGVHHVHTPPAVAFAVKGDPLPVRRPGGVVIVPRALAEVDRVAALGLH